MKFERQSELAARDSDLLIGAIKYNVRDHGVVLPGKTVSLIAVSHMKKTWLEIGDGLMRKLRHGK